MKNARWSARRLLAWVWVGCLGLLLLTTYSPLRFNSSTKHFVTIWLAWLLASVALSYFARLTTSRRLRRLAAWLPRVQGAGALLLLVCWLLTLPFLGRPVFSEYFLPYDDPDYTQADPLLSRGPEQVYQVHWDDDPHAYTRPVRVRYLPCLLVWATPLPPASLESTWQVRSAAGLELLAPRYRPAAQADLASRWYESQHGAYARDEERREAERASQESERIAQKGEAWRAQHSAEATH